MLALAAMMMAPMWGWGQSTYTENFDIIGNWGGGTAGSYNAKTYTSTSDPANDQFSSNSAIREGTEVNSGSYAWRLNSGAFYFRYECEATVNSFSLWMARWDNAPVPSMTIRYSTNSGSSYTDIVTIDGSWFTGDKVYKQYTYSFPSAISPASGQTIFIEITKTAGERLLIDDFVLNYGSGSSTPAITVNPSTLTGFTYVQGSGPSAEQTFTVSGTDLSEDISIAATANYEISKASGSGYTTPLIFTQTDGSVAEQTVYVRMKSGLSAGDYDNEVITAASTGATDKTVTVSGTVTPPPVPTITVTPATLTGFSYVEGSGPSTEQTYTVEGTNLTGNISITPPTNYEISTGTGGAFVATNPILLTQTGGTVANTTIYVRLKTGLGAGSYNSEEIIASSTGADTKTVTCSGSVTIPGAGGGLEDFTNSNATSSYTDGSFVGNNGITWTYVDSRDGNGDANSSGITLPALMLRRSLDNSAVSSSAISGGIGDFSVKLYKGFTGNGNRQVELFINGVSKGTSTPFNDYDEHIFTVNGIDISGDVVIKITNPTSNQVIVDDISWTGFGTGGNTPPAITNIIQTPSTGINSSSTVSVSADVTDSDGTVEAVALYWGTTSGSLTNNIDMALGSGNTYTTVTDIPAQAGGTTVYYEIYALDDDADETTSPEQSYFVIAGEPTNHVTTFMADVASPAYSAIDVVWDDAIGGTIPDGYLIKASEVSYAAIAEPVDGIEETAGLLVKVVAPGVQVANFTGLNPEQTYYFKIWPYTNSGAAIDYKTDGAVPQVEATTAVAPPIPAIYFSEYIEGSSNNKALEIYNGTGSSIDLSLLTVNTYANGSTTVTNFFTGTGTLVQGATFVIGNSGAAAGIASKADVTSSVTYFNGNDAVELVYDGRTIDIIGVIGTDPGTAWDVAGTTNATIDHTLIRKLNITTGNTNWAASAGTDVNDSEWVVKDIDYFENLSFVGTVWQGVSTDWTAEANWDMGVPSIYQAWVVPAAETPVVSTTETASDVIVLGNNLHISPTGFLTVINLLGIVEPGMVTVEPLGKLSGEVINFGTADLMVIQSDATGTGSVITDWNSQATIQRYLTGGWDSWDAGWHQISSPVAAQPIADFATTGSGNDYDFYGWDEPTDTWMNYKAAGFSTWNGGTNFNVGQGYLVSYEAANSTQTFTGELNTADVTIENMSNGNNGWHLLGNPYASALVWNDDNDNWVLTNVAGTAKIWHEASKSYSDIAANGIIPSAQGFMVQVNNSSNSLLFLETARTHSATPFYKAGTEQLLLVAAETEGGSAQESKIMVNPMATEGFDFDYDSRFLAGYAPQLYSVVGDELLSTNSLPELASGKVIPLGFVKNAATAFTIQLKESIPGAVVYLTDIQTGTVTNLTENPVYSFTSNEGDDANRFTLAFGTVGINHPEATDGVQVYAHNGVLYVETPSKQVAQLSVYNLTGQLVMQGRTGGSALSTFNASALNTGVYVVNVVLNEGVVSRKVVINK